MTLVIDIWKFGLFAIIFLYYLGVSAQSSLLWTPSAVIMLIPVIYKQRINKQILYDLRWFLIMLLWITMSIMWSIDFEATFIGIRRLMFMVIVAIFAYNFPWTQMDAARALGVFIISIVSCVCVYYTVKFGTLRPIEADVDIRFTNLIAAAIVASTPLVLFNERRHTTLYIAIVLIICMFVMVMTESRAGLILYGVAVALSFAFRNSIKMINITVFAATSTFIIVFGYVIIEFYLPDLGSRLDSIADTLSVFGYGDASRLSRDTNDFARKIQMLFTVQQMAGVPISGLGYNAFGAAIENATGFYIQAHSLFGTFFVELGLVGFLIFLAFNARLAVDLIRNGNDLQRPQKARVARMAFVGLILVNLYFLSRPQMYEVTYFVVLGLAMGAARPSPKGALSSRYSSYHADGDMRRVQ